jgi:tyrosine phenol-lyase
MTTVRFYGGEAIPLEMHKVRIVQKLNLPPVERRLDAMNEAGNNTFLLQNVEVFMDMLTDSGVNAMSDQQLAAMMIADDSYAGSATYTRLESKLRELFGMHYILPTHQGRACENILAQVLVSPGTVVPMNYHFTTTKAHITLNGGSIEELVAEEGLEVVSVHPFKGNMDIAKLRAVIANHGATQIAFVRMEAGTNLIGGQPFSLAKPRRCPPGVRRAWPPAGPGRQPAGRQPLLRQGARGSLQGHEHPRDHPPLRGPLRCHLLLRPQARLRARRRYVHALRGTVSADAGPGAALRGLPHLRRHVGARDRGPDRRSRGDHGRGHDQPGAHLYRLYGGGAGAARHSRHHPGGRARLSHQCPQVPRSHPPVRISRRRPGSALYIASGIRGMERGTLSEQREPDGTEVFANMELLRLALPRRVFTLSQVKYAIDRIQWLYDNRRLIGGLVFTEEPEILRFFFGRLTPVSNWQQELVAKFRQDFGDSL